MSSQPFISGVADSSRSVMRGLYIFSYTISHVLLWTVFKSGKFKGHSCSGINSGVSLCNNSMVAHVQQALQVSQGSVETLFRWGGEHLHHFWANLFRKQRIKFHQQSPSFIGDITKKITSWSLFFWTQLKGLGRETKYNHKLTFCYNVVTESNDKSEEDATSQMLNLHTHNIVFTQNRPLSLSWKSAFGLAYDLVPWPLTLKTFAPIPIHMMIIRGKLH